VQIADIHAQKDNLLKSASWHAPRAFWQQRLRLDSTAGKKPSPTQSRQLEIVPQKAGHAEQLRPRHFWRRETAAVKSAVETVFGRWKPARNRNSKPEFRIKGVEAG